MVVEQIIRLLGNIILTGFIAKHLKPEGFGVLSHALNIIAVAMPIACAGLEDTVLKRLLTAKVSERASIVTTAVYTRLLSGVMVSLLVALVVLNISQVERTEIILVLSLGLISQAPSVAEKILQCDSSLKRIATARILTFLGSSVIRIILLLSDAPLVAFAWVITVEPILAFGVVYFLTPQSLKPKLTEGFVPREAKELLIISWPFLTSGVLVAAYFRVEQLVVMQLLGACELGKYAAAARIAACGGLMVPVLLSSILPRLLREGASEAGTKIGAGFVVQPEFERLLRAGAVYGLLLAAATMLLSPIVIVSLFGDSYADAIPIAIILSAVPPALISGGVRAHFVLIHGCTSIHNWAAALGIGINFGAAFILIPRIGPIGAAAGSVLGAYSSAIGTSLLSPSLKPFGILQLRAFAAALKLRNWMELLPLNSR
jgi:O-antigen/teichoic acid export membrane protein